MAADGVETLPGCGHELHGEDSDHTDPEFAEDELLEIDVTHAGKTFTIHLPPQATVEDVSLMCESELRSRDSPENGSDYTVTKLIAPPPLGLINITKDAEKLVADLVSAQGGRDRKLKLRLMATPTKAVDALRKTSEAMKQRETRLADLRRRAVRARTTAPRGGSGGAGPSNSEFTFGDIQPLPHLPHPERSLAYLHRLRDDVGIRHVMKTHQFRVGLLTEMDPLMYTESNHEGTSRTLGLNRNHGQVIELRLRTDAGDGYRDYKTVRQTLCHELAHNVHGPHDKHFWALYRQLDREVERADYHGSGRSLTGYSDGDFYQPSASARADDDYEHEHVDSGGWTGGTFVLGSGEASSAASSSAATTAASTGPAADVNAPAAQRERRARAAEERLRRTGGGGDGQAHQSGGGSSTNQ